MKHRLAALALLLPLAGCYSGYGQPDVGPYPGGSHGGGSSTWGAPLQARLAPSGNGLSVSLNDRAYIAVFRVAPGWGAQLVYPAFGSERSLYRAGYSRISINPRAFDSRYSIPGAYGYGTGGHADGSGWYGSQNPGRGATYFLLVASREPLYLRRLQQSPYALRDALGYDRFVTADLQEMTDDIVSLVLQRVRNEDWSTDVLADWGLTSAAYQPYGGGYYGGGYGRTRYTTVRCPDGRLVRVPTYYTYRDACYRGQRGPVTASPPPPRPKNPGGGGHGDTTDVDVPGRRRPAEPREPAGTDGQRQPLGPRVNPMARQPKSLPEPGSDESRRAEPRVYARPPQRQRAEPKPRPEPRAEPRVERRPNAERRVERVPRSEPRATPPARRRPTNDPNR